jgi:hypothetical protein
VTVGRFQAWEIANHFGMALDYATLERQGAWIVSASLPRPTDGYGLTYFWDRQNFLLGTYALHVYPTKYLRGELLGHVGVGNSANASNPYQMDIRPSAIFDIGWVKLKAGYEYGKAIPQDKEEDVRDSRNGWGLAAQQQVPGDRQGRRVFAVAQVEDRVVRGVALAPGDPAPVLPLAHRAEVIERGVAVARVAGAPPVHQERHHAALHLAGAVQVCVVGVQLPGKLRALAVCLGHGLHQGGGLLEDRVCRFRLQASEFRLADVETGMSVQGHGASFRFVGNGPLPCLSPLRLASQDPGNSGSTAAAWLANRTLSMHL